MNQDIKESREKARVFDQLIAAIRISQNASDMMDEAFAQLLGVNRTDGRCLDVVQRMGQITAGELAAQAGLTTGAVTAIIDRLEMAGYLRRVRDTKDRRKVFVELTEVATKLGETVYAQIGAISAEGMNNLTIEKMDLIARFLRTSAEMNRLLSGLLREYAASPGHDHAERMRAAKNFAARIAREQGALRDLMMQSWNDDAPDTPSGKLPK